MGHKNRLCVVTAEAFFQIEIPIIPEIKEKYTLFWIPIMKRNSNRYKTKEIKSFIKNNNISSKIINIKWKFSDLRIIRNYYKIIKTIKIFNPDIIYINFTGRPFFIPMLYFLLKKFKNVIIATHNAKTPLGAKNYYFARLYQKLIFKIFTNFHVYSYNQKKYIQNHYTNRNLFYAPIPLEDCGMIPGKIHNRDNKIRFLFFGVIQDYKRLDLLIKAFCNVYKMVGNKFTITIAGNTSNWAKYNSLIEYPEIFDLKIRFIDKTEISDLFCNCHYLVQPYQDATQSGPLKIAYYYNIPVIASNIEAFRECITDKKTGYLFSVNDQDNLEKALLYVIKNHKEKYYNLKQNLKLYVEKELSLESIVQKYENMFNSLIEEKIINE